VSVLATIEPAELKVDPGSETSLVVRVRNRGTIVDRFDVAVVGPTAAWASVDPPSLRLFPDKEGEARVTFRPPRAPDPTADVYPFGVAVKAASDVNASTVEEGRITVSPFVQLTTEIVPQTSRGSRSGSHDVTVHNRGNTVAEVSVTGSDPDRLLDVEMLPARAGLRPDGSASIRARVKPKQTFLMGAPKRIPFTIVIDEPSAGASQLSASMEQRAIIPSWVRPAIGLALAGLAAIVFLPSLLTAVGILPTPVPSQVAVASLEPTPTPVPITEPPATDAPIITDAPTPSPEVNGQPDTFLVTEDLNPTSGLVLECQANQPCRDTARTLLTQILTNLQTKADGTKLLDFESSPDGSLPLLVEWDDGVYQYTTAVGESGETDRVRVDLAPFIAGVPGYVLIHDKLANQTRKYTLPPGDGKALYDLLYEYTPLPDPTLLPLPSGLLRYDLFIPIERQWIFDIDWT
jgi:hypothetical protein